MFSVKGFWGLGFWGLGFWGLGFWGLGFWGIKSDQNVRLRSEY